MDIRFWVSGKTNCTVAGWNAQVANEPWSKLYIVDSGEAAYAICRAGYEWQKIKLVPGNIYLIPGSCAHHHSCVADFRLHWCHFTVDDDLQPRLAAMPQIRAWPLSQVISDAPMVLQEAWKPQRLRAAGLVLNLLAELPEPEVTELATERAQIFQALNHLHNFFALDHQISDLAKRCDLHASRFQQLFRQVLDTTPGEYLVQLRLAEARRLLSGTTLPIGTIGEMVGWSNPYHFSRIFRTKLGTSPRAWRACGGSPPQTGAPHEQILTPLGSE